MAAYIVEQLLKNIDRDYVEELNTIPIEVLAEMYTDNGFDVLLIENGKITGIVEEINEYI